MRIGLHDAERDHMKGKTFPNFALMKLSAYHKARGDAVEIWNPVNNAAYGVVYSSKVFDFTPENPYLPANTVKGGTGYGLTTCPRRLTRWPRITPCTPAVITPSATSQEAVQIVAGGVMSTARRATSGPTPTGGRSSGPTRTSWF